jgi:hypothetical protein
VDRINLLDTNCITGEKTRKGQPTRIVAHCSVLGLSQGSKKQDSRREKAGLEEGHSLY